MTGIDPREIVVLALIANWNRHSNITLTAATAPASMLDDAEHIVEKLRAAMLLEPLENWREEAWRCYVESGADPDGADARHLNIGEAPAAVAELYADYEDALGERVDDETLERAAYAVWELDAKKSPRIDPEAIWERVKPEYVKRQRAAFRADGLLPEPKGQEALDG